MSLSLSGVLFGQKQLILLQNMAILAETHNVEAVRTNLAMIKEPRIKQEGFSTSVWFCCCRGWKDHAIYLPPHAVQPGVLVFALAFSLNLLCQPFQADCYAAWGWISCQEGQACQARILLILFSVIIEELPASCWWDGWANLHTCPQLGITPLFPNQPLLAGSVLGKGSKKTKRLNKC